MLASGRPTPAYLLWQLSASQWADASKFIVVIMGAECISMARCGCLCRCVCGHQADRRQLITPCEADRRQLIIVAVEWVYYHECILGLKCQLTPVRMVASGRTTPALTHAGRSSW